MKAIVALGPGQLAWQERPVPQPGPGQVRIRTAACGVCATDLQMIRGWSRTGFPAIPGHEWSGVVDAAGGGVDGALVGQPCVAENVLADGGEVGFEHPGGYGQCLLTEARNVRPLPDGFPLDHAALIEPLAVCVRALRRMRLERTDAALVFGDGPIGLLMLALLKHAGVRRVALVGGRAARLAAAQALGADVVFNYHEAGAALPQALAAAAGTPGSFAAVVEASGSPRALALALDAAAVGAKVLVVGDYGDNHADFPWNRLLHREWELIGSNASAGAWDEAVALATGGRVPLGRLISHRFPAHRYAEAIAAARDNRDALKVVLDWSAEAAVT